MVTVNYLVAQNLMEVIMENGEYFLTELPSLIGSETASTGRLRKSREQKALQYNNGETPCNLLKQNCNGEIEIEKEGEIEGQNLPHIFYGEYKNIRLTDEEYRSLTDKLQSHTDTMIEKLSRYIKSSWKIYQDHYVKSLIGMNRIRKDYHR